MDVVYHTKYQSYDFGPHHPFSPVRLQMLVSLLEALEAMPEPVAPEPAMRADVLTVHDEALVEQVAAASEGQPRPDARHYGLATADVPAFDGMDEAARWLVGGTLAAARRVADGVSGIALQLGGGLHHADAALASGFCVYNDLSVAIRHLRDRGLRVAYVDVDVHHGDGVQSLHYDDPGVLTISMHEAGRYLFPGTGAVHELGEGVGKGYALNVPLEPYTMGDSFLDAFERVVPHALSRFHPDVLVVQCGADAHYRDPLADLLLTTHDYATLFGRLRALAEEHAGGHAVFTLGGGYDLDATVRTWALLYHVLAGLDLPDHLPEDWLAHWQDRVGTPLTPTLHDESHAFDRPDAGAVREQNRRTSTRLMETAVRYWY